MAFDPILAFLGLVLSAEAELNLPVLRFVGITLVLEEHPAIRELDSVLTAFMIDDDCGSCLISLLKAAISGSARPLPLHLDLLISRKIRLVKRVFTTYDVLGRLSLEFQRAVRPLIVVISRVFPVKIKALYYTWIINRG